MIDFMKFLLLGLWLAMMFVPGKQALHMFQQNRYELRRYLPWIQERAAHHAKNAIWIVLFYLPWIIIAYAKSSVWTQTITLFAIALVSAVLILRENKKKYIKPLVFTARVKRQVVFMVVLDFLLVYPIVYFASWQVIVLLSPIILVINWLLLVPMAVVTAPIEDFVKSSGVPLEKRR